LPYGQSGQELCLKIAKDHISKLNELKNKNKNLVSNLIKAQNSRSDSVIFSIFFFFFLLLYNPKIGLITLCPSPKKNNKNKNKNTHTFIKLSPKNVGPLDDKNVLHKIIK
jgi:hypothetical protein